NITVRGVVAEGERPGLFAVENKPPDSWNWIELPKLAAVLLHARTSTHAPHAPKTTITNAHLNGEFVHAPETTITNAHLNGELVSDNTLPSRTRETSTTNAPSSIEAGSMNAQLNGKEEEESSSSAMESLIQGTAMLEMCEPLEAPFVPRDRSLRNKHLEYAGTWFSLCFASLAYLYLAKRPRARLGWRV
ncbi:MAG: hypothetical protein SGCHY_004746, partial [Lobulomycetales sp.]